MSILLWVDTKNFVCRDSDHSQLFGRRISEHQFTDLSSWLISEWDDRLHSVIAGDTTYSQLEPRTKLMVLFLFFENKFQHDSVNMALTNFRFTTQFDG